jgi:hypothetical protein
MALTFTSWTNYTDEEGAKTLDWSSADAIRGHLLRPHAEAVRQAIKERYLALQTHQLISINITAPEANPAVPVWSPIGTIPAILVSEIPLYGPALGSWAYGVQSAVTFLLSQHVNHVDNSGDWTGQDSIPDWTEEAILTDIGDDSRLDYGGFPSADWIFQQYQILKRLQWLQTFIRYHPVSGTNFLTRQSRKGFNYWPWDDFLSAFAAASWQAELSASESYGAEVASVYYAGTWNPGLIGTGFVGSRYRTRYPVISNASFDSDVDAYSLFYSLAGRIYENADYGNAENTLASIEKNISLDAGQRVYKYVGNFDECTQSEPAPSENLGYAHSGMFFVKKFNVPGGFIFQ